MGLTWAQGQAPWGLSPLGVQPAALIRSGQSQCQGSGQDVFSARVQAGHRVRHRNNRCQEPRRVRAQLGEQESRVGEDLGA